MGNDSGIRHTWSDSTVTNGQLYYYAVTAYDYGSDSLNFYPSENTIAVSRTLRAGLILPENAVAVRPEPRVLGWVPAKTEEISHISGDGTGQISIRVVNSGLVPEGHLFKITFASPSPDDIRATSYALIDSSAQKRLFRTGRDLEGEGIGPVGGGLLPLISTQKTVTVNPDSSGFVPPRNIRLKVKYQLVLPINQRRTGFPDDITITFDDVVRDTSFATFVLPARPAKFVAVAHTKDGDRQLDFRFYDVDLDSTLSRPDEYVDFATYAPDAPTVPVVTWRAQLDTLGQAARGPIVPPRLGDKYELKLNKPFGAGDVFVFTARGEHVDPTRAAGVADTRPYVVPNPYVGSASFEPQHFAISGRGERRMEFRNLPQRCTIRIYTVRGELVQTLRQDGSNAGFVAWNLRTKDNLDVAPGLYIYQVDGGSVGSNTGKFAIIK
jgi:hypothetical protein